ncbi:MAG: GNAT family N-acetyltransferase [Candidatus Lokiarchaeota archaeon]|nr:GNAT family N-acetyltransferase [Candidatus Lokiarchaeota archaeon]
MDNLFRLKRNQVKLAAKLLARAFENNPVCIAFFPDPTKRVKQNYHLMKNSIRYCMRFGEVYTTSPKLEGIALWQLEDSREEQQDKPISLSINWFNFVLAVALGKSLEKVRSVYDYVYKTHFTLVPSRHWYFFVIGVDPNFQGKGFASSLIKPMLARIDKEQLRCYLDTNNEKNVGLYQHFGFKVLKKYQIPGTNVINWSMSRENPL